MSLGCTHMSSVCDLYLTVCNGMSLGCTRMSSVFHLFVFICHPYVTCMCSYAIRMSLVCTRMPCACHSYVFVCHLYATCMYSYVIRMSLVCACMSSVCHSNVVLPWTIRTNQSKFTFKNLPINQYLMTHLQQKLSSTLFIKTRKNFGRMIKRQLF